MEPASAHILITGGSGRLGTILCKLLAEKGFTPIIFDNFSGSAKPENILTVEGDIKSPLALLACLRHYKPAAVIHLAGKTSMDDNNPLAVYHNNVTGTLALLAAMKETGVANLLYSMVIYGGKTDDAVAHSKAMVANILTDCGKAGWLNFKVIGEPGQTAEDVSGLFLTAVQEWTSKV